MPAPEKPVTHAVFQTLNKHTHSRDILARRPGSDSFKRCLATKKSGTGRKSCASVCPSGRDDADDAAKASVLALWQHLTSLTVIADKDQLYDDVVAFTELTYCGIHRGKKTLVDGLAKWREDLEDWVEEEEGEEEMCAADDTLTSVFSETSVANMSSVCNLSSEESENTSVFVGQDGCCDEDGAVAGSEVAPPDDDWSMTLDKDIMPMPAPVAAALIVKSEVSAPDSQKVVVKEEDGASPSTADDGSERLDSDAVAVQDGMKSAPAAAAPVVAEFEVSAPDSQNAVAKEKDDASLERSSDLMTTAAPLISNPKPVTDEPVAVKVEMPATPEVAMPTTASQSPEAASCLLQCRRLESSLHQSSSFPKWTSWKTLSHPPPEATAAAAAVPSLGGIVSAPAAEAAFVAEPEPLPSKVVLVKEHTKHLRAAEAARGAEALAGHGQETTTAFIVSQLTMSDVAAVAPPPADIVEAKSEQPVSDGNDGRSSNHVDGSAKAVLVPLHPLGDKKVPRGQSRLHSGYEHPACVASGTALPPLPVSGVSSAQSESTQPPVVDIQLPRDSSSPAAAEPQPLTPQVTSPDEAKAAPRSPPRLIVPVRGSFVTSTKEDAEKEALGARAGRTARALQDVLGLAMSRPRRAVRKVRADFRQGYQGDEGAQ